jgi:hypothetical protein
MTLRCPGSETGGCRADLDITTRSLVRVGRLRLRLQLATLVATLRPGQTQRFRVRLPAGMAQLFGRRRSLAVRLVGDTTDASGNVTVLTGNLTLRLPRRRASAARRRDADEPRAAQRRLGREPGLGQPAQ